LTSTLRDKARAAAGGGQQPNQATLPAPSDSSAPAETLEAIEYTGPITDAEQIPVHVAFARVMADVQSVRKGDARDDAGGRYKFRGVDRVVNAVGPALRRHGVLVTPARIFDVEYRDTRTTNNKPMQECTLKVEWAVTGPKGDVLPTPLQSAGQATDTGDKATAKAVSVAHRVLLLTSLHIPTEDPTIDQGHDRGEVPAPSPVVYRDEAVHPATSLGRLRAMRAEVGRHGLGSVAVVNENGDDEPLLALIDRIGRERRGGESSLRDTQQEQSAALRRVRDEPQA
jgi:hypothetical protein